MNAAILLIASALPGAGEIDVQYAHLDRQPVRNVLRAGANVIRNRPVRNILRRGANVLRGGVSVIRKGASAVRNRKRHPVRNILRAIPNAVRRVARIRFRRTNPTVEGVNAPTPQNE